MSENAGAIVTGAGSGVSKAVPLILVRRSVNVIAIGGFAEPLAELRAEAPAPEEINKHMAAQYGPRGMRINAIAPGVPQTAVDGGWSATGFLSSAAIAAGEST